MPDSTLLNRLRRHAADSPDRPAYVDPNGRSLSYGKLLRAVESLASQLQDGQGRMLRCPNQVEFAAWFLAAQMAGVELMPVPCGTTDAEVVRLAKRAGLKHFIGDLRELNAAAFTTLRPLEFSFDAAAVPATDRPRGGILLASSGSTSEPSLVRRNAKSLDAVAQNVAEVVGMTPDDRVLATVPLAHSYGLEHGLLGPVWGGATVLLCPGLEWAALRRQLQRRPTVLPAVPAVIEMLPGMADGADITEAVQSVRCVYSAGAPLPAPAREAFHAAFGQQIGQIYGMTEIGSVTFNDPTAADFDPASVGRPMAGVSIRLLDEQDGEGEVAVRSTCMFEGYVDRHVDLIDGHLPTGDLGQLGKDGHLTITGRKRLLIETGGQKVNPLEVESVIRSHPAVRDCVVVPVYQTATSSRLRAVVVPHRSASPPAPADIREHVRARLAAFKVPRLVEFRDSLPYTATGKVARAELEAL